jgi:hypothetical protein
MFALTSECTVVARRSAAMILTAPRDTPHVHVVVDADRELECSATRGGKMSITRRTRALVCLSDEEFSASGIGSGDPNVSRCVMSELAAADNPTVELIVHELSPRVPSADAVLSVTRAQSGVMPVMLRTQLNPYTAREVVRLARVVNHLSISVIGMDRLAGDIEAKLLDRAVPQSESAIFRGLADRIDRTGDLFSPQVILLAIQTPP